MVKKWVINFLSFILKQFLKIVPPAVVQKNILNIANNLETYSNSFFSYHLRPKIAKDITLTNNKNYSNIGIIIQGPLVFEQNFTLETVKLYKKFFKNAIIVISTWEGENNDYVNIIRNEGIFIVLNKKPEKSGALNSNYQIVSTLAGLRLLETKGVEYLLKTRSDQRIYNYQSIELFQKLIHNYPAINSFQKNRIISINLTTLKYMPYALGDMCMFGSLSDLINYWNIELENRELDREVTVGLSIKELTKLNVAETFYCTQYLNKIGFPTLISINNSWKAYRELFIVVDYTSVDLFWYKYNREFEYKYRFYQENSFELFKYIDWLDNTECDDENKIFIQIYGSKRIN